MRRTILVFMLSLSLLGAALAQRQGDEAIDFTLVDRQGEALTLSDFHGTPLVLNVWASWCPPCVEELPLFQETSDALNEEEETVTFLLLNNNENPQTASQFLENMDITLPSALDATREQKAQLEAEGLELTTTFDVLRAYRVRGMPTTFFIDSEGMIQGVIVGLVIPSTLSEQLSNIGVEYRR